MGKGPNYIFREWPEKFKSYQDFNQTKEYVDDIKKSIRDGLRKHHAKSDSRVLNTRPLSELQISLPVILLFLIFPPLGIYWWMKKNK